MHLALARKYRPQNFLEVIGQDAIIKTMQNAIESERLHHAYLFSGVRGIGKTSMARILAKSINCEKGASITPCQTCTTCQSITGSHSLDVIEIDGASNNLVDDVRELREQVKYLPTSGKYKIIIIDEVHMLSNSAFNALLKTLEEPPAHVIFIFATTEPHKIPMTILSRCQKYDFKKANTAVLNTHLGKIAKDENVSIHPDAVHLISQCAQGSVRDAVSLFDQVISFKERDIKEDDVREVLGLGDRLLTQEMFEKIIKEDLTPCIDCLNKVDGCGIDLKLFADSLLMSFRHLILLTATGQVPEGLSQSEKEFFKGLKGVLDVSLLLAQYQILFQGIKDLIHTDFPKTAFEITLVKLSQVRQMIGLADLVDQLKNRQGSARSAPQAVSHSMASRPVPVQQSVVPQVGQKKAADWYELVRWITSEKPPLGGLLKDAVPISFSEDSIEVALAPNSNAREILMDRSDSIKQLIDKHFGKSVSFTLSDLEDPKKKALSLTELEANLKKKKRQGAQKEVLDNDGVKTLLDEYGAKLKDIVMKE
jgi:DNA polymerase III subunit gamma/tau